MTYHHAPATSDAAPWWKCGPLIPALAAAYRNEWPVSRPWEPPAPRLGRIDFWRCHGLALDNLGTLLDRLLPRGGETPCRTYWEGSHPARPLVIRVSLLSGAWTELDTGKSAADLVSLVAHCMNCDPWRASRLICGLCDVPEIANA